ncbi:MAG: GTPase ObgE [Candidatus Hydrogenedentes bacterium]|nr:GTPase ObgE [Candidatus Hydrogenedentota bacterium]
MFVDRTRIRVTGGAGGNGCCSFRREKYVPRGGPNGGDGGNGGSVYFLADARYTSLLDLRFHAHRKGNPGVHGQGSDCHGKNGEDIYIHVPTGTVIRRTDTGDVVADLTEDGQTFRAALGGRGGKGNARFVSSVDRAPRFAEKGEPGEDFEYDLELKVIAEVGLVGLPNAGKSTFLASVTAAKPKIADYPFTTLSPNLGVASLSDYRTLTIADIPGIIEGAAEGKGLGHDFLRHIERTRVLLFLIDLGDADPMATCAILENELEQHSEVFASRPKVFALNKADISENRARYTEVATQFDSPWLISGATGEGIPELLEHLWALVDRVRQQELSAEAPLQELEFVFEAPFEVTRTDGGLEVKGKAVLRAVRMTDFSNDEAVRYLHKKFQRMGLLKALKRMGAKEGETIVIGDVELEYHSE